jgi:hypothetical protein
VDIVSALIMRQNVLLCDMDDCQGFFVPKGSHQHPYPGRKPVSSGAFLVDIVTTRDRAEEAGWVTSVKTGLDTWIDICPCCIAAAEKEARR